MAKHRRVHGRKAAIFLWLAAGGGCANAPAPPDTPAHHTANGFRNVPTVAQPDFGDFLKWRWQRLTRPREPNADTGFPLAKNNPEFLRDNRHRTTVTWIGHATVLLQIDGVNILTDPQFSRRASPLSWVGPERVVSPGVPMEALPDIDIVLISHDHYDSLDRPSIEALRRRRGGAETVFYVPLGLRVWLNDIGVDKVVELDWWQHRDTKGLTVTAVPVQHWSKRGLFDRDTRLWAGWAVTARDFRFLFAGDSGYTVHFREIGRRLGPFDLAAIPIGAYAPRWFMQPHHLSPEDAVRVHQDLRSKKSIAIHWGTFALADEPLNEPPTRLRAARGKAGLDADEFVVLAHGETLVLP